MARLDGQDRPGGRQVLLRENVLRGAEVGADADAFEYGGGGEERCDGGRVEGVSTFCRGRCAGS